MSNDANGYARQHTFGPVTERAVTKVSDDNDSEDNNPDDNYGCQYCEYETYIDDYQQHAPAWCLACDTTRSFERLE